MRAPEDCLQAIGIVHHPDTQQYRTEDGKFSSNVPDNIAKAIIYRCDLLTIHSVFEGMDDDADDPDHATLLGQPPLVAPPSPARPAAPSSLPPPGPHGGDADEREEQEEYKDQGI